MKHIQEAGYTLAELIIALISIVAIIGIPALVIWVVVHFVAKFW